MAKATKKQALGRGLSALLKDPANDIQSAEDKNAAELVGNIVELEVASIEVNPYQPRTNFNEEALQELAASIKELGVIQPITVRKIGFDKFQLVSGERRFRASKMVGLTTIPAYIRIANDQEVLEMALVENIQRQDLDPIEVALTYQRLIEEIDLTQEKLSERVGKKRSTITNYLRLLKLDPIVQTGMRDGFLSMGHGRALISVEKKSDQLDIYERIITQNLSVRETENLVKRLREQSIPSVKAEKEETPKFVRKGIKDLTSYFSTKVDVSLRKNGSGKLVIPFSSEEEFARLKKLIKGDS